jgi:hypothetical protein
MLLDAVLADQRQWLGTERDKVAYFTPTHRVPRTDLPALTFRADARETIRCFADKLPVGLGPDGRTFVFLYLVTRPLPMDFRMFLERHAELLRALPAWTRRLIVPPHFTNTIARSPRVSRAGRNPAATDAPG